MTLLQQLRAILKYHKDNNTPKGVYVPKEIVDKAKNGSSKGFYQDNK